MTPNDLKQLEKKNHESITTEYIPLSVAYSLLLNGNSKRHDIPQLIELIRRYGFVSPVAYSSLLNDGQGGVVAGNGRVEALVTMKAQGANPPKNIKVQGEEWLLPVHFGAKFKSEADAIAYSIDDNASNLYGLDLAEKLRLFDEDLLREQIQGLAEDEIPRSLFEDEDDLQALLQEELAREEGGEDSDFDGEGDRVQLGEIWQLGRHRIYCADSREPGSYSLLLEGTKVDMVFADPPYGVKEQTKRYSAGRSHVAKALDFPEIIGDASIDTAQTVFEIISAWGCIIIYFGANFYDFLPPSSSWLVWDKRDGVSSDDNADCELAWTNKGGPARIFSHLWKGCIKASEHGEQRIHPTQKPVQLAEWAFENYGNPTTVLDPFLGSGSTLIACEQSDRACYGLELSPTYCSKIIARWEKLTGEKAEKC